ncbi:HlyU family transcriptional regulator [Halomonas sp. H5]|uniref:HlyU family transcriptional regulator n=1 Tax=Halomonas sp. H5 TaxID=3423910 RepID=UPI003D360477
MFKKLLSGLFGQGEAKASPEAEPVEYRGYRIIPDCQEQGGQYRVSGWIRLPVDGGEVKEHRFERSDVVPGRAACEQLMISKAQRFIDDIGEAMFEPR